MIRKVGLIFATLVCGGIAVAACSSSSTPAGNGGGGDSGGGGGGDTGGGMSVTLVGSYGMCALTPNVMITAPVMMTYNKPIMGGTASITGSGSNLTAVISGGGGDAGGGINCSLMVTATGDTGTITKQTCDATISGFPVVITFTSGTVTVAPGDGGEVLTAMSNITISGTDGGINIVGTGTLDGTCIKM